MAEDFSFYDAAKSAASVAGFVSNPIGATISMVGGEISRSKPEENINQGDASMLDYGPQGFNRGMSMQPSNQGGNDGGFLSGLGQTLGGFGRDVGGFIQDISPLTNLFGINTPAPSSSAGSARTIQRMGPEETATSGQILGANLGLGSNLIQAASRFARSPGGGTAIGFGAGALGAALQGGQNGTPRITRRMKSDVRRVYNMSMGNADITAQILNQMGTYPKIRFDAATVFFILTKRFRNDGPVVTKAAVRKTKSTLRRMKGVVDMYNSVCKPTTRRAPARRAAPKAVQLIKN
jgi:hypothetical protein